MVSVDAALELSLHQIGPWNKSHWKYGISWARACTIKTSCMHNAVLGMVNRHGQSIGMIPGVSDSDSLITRTAWHAWSLVGEQYMLPQKAAKLSLRLPNSQYLVFSMDNNDNNRQTDWSITVTLSTYVQGNTACGVITIIIVFLWIYFPSHV